MKMVLDFSKFTANEFEYYLISCISDYAYVMVGGTEEDCTLKAVKRKILAQLIPMIEPKLNLKEKEYVGAMLQTLNNEFLDFFNRKPPTADQLYKSVFIN